MSVSVIHRWRISCSQIFFFFLSSALHSPFCGKPCDYFLITCLLLQLLFFFFLMMKRKKRISRPALKLFGQSVCHPLRLLQFDSLGIAPPIIDPQSKFFWLFFYCLFHSYNGLSFPLDHFLFLSIPLNWDYIRINNFTDPLHWRHSPSNSQ